MLGTQTIKVNYGDEMLKKQREEEKIQSSNDLSYCEDLRIQEDYEGIQINVKGKQSNKKYQPKLKKGLNQKPLLKQETKVVQKKMVTFKEEKTNVFYQPLESYNLSKKEKFFKYIHFLGIQEKDKNNIYSRAFSDSVDWLPQLLFINLMQHHVLFGSDPQKYIKAFLNNIDFTERTKFNMKDLISKFIQFLNQARNSLKVIERKEEIAELSFLQVILQKEMIYLFQNYLHKLNIYESIEKILKIPLQKLIDPNTIKTKEIWNPLRQLMEELKINLFIGFKERDKSLAMRLNFNGDFTIHILRKITKKEDKDDYKFYQVYDNSLLLQLKKIKEINKSITDLKLLTNPTQQHVECNRCGQKNYENVVLKIKVCCHYLCKDCIVSIDKPSADKCPKCTTPIKEQDLLEFLKKFKSFEPLKENFIQQCQNCNKKNSISYNVRQKEALFQVGDKQLSIKEMKATLKTFKCQSCLSSPNSDRLCPNCVSNKLTTINKFQIEWCKNCVSSNTGAYIGCLSCRKHLNKNNSKQGCPCHCHMCMENITPAHPKFYCYSCFEVCRICRVQKRTRNKFYCKECSFIVCVPCIFKVYILKSSLSIDEVKKSCIHLEQKWKDILNTSIQNQ